MRLAPEKKFNQEMLFWRRQVTFLQEYILFNAMTFNDLKVKIGFLVAKRQVTKPEFLFVGFFSLCCIFVLSKLNAVNK